MKYGVHQGSSCFRAYTNLSIRGTVKNKAEISVEYYKKSNNRMLFLKIIKTVFITFIITKLLIFPIN